ncbi:MAG: 2,3-bisphosphoglycerate-independent phosphoglycerate mutase [bacterium]
MKIVLLIIDGLGDRPITKLGRKTPLAAAITPNLDYLAKEGICGLVKPFIFPKETAPTSEGAHTALLGYQRHFLGRGAYEAAGVGMDLREGDVAFRVNFATVDENLKIIDRRAGRISDTEELVSVLNGMTIKGVKFFLKKAYGHRAVLLLRGPGLSTKIGYNDPHQTGIKPKIIKEAPALNEFLSKAAQILREHPLNKQRIKKNLPPANYLLIRGPGQLKEMPSFMEKYGLKACCVAGGGLYKGVAKILGMDLISVSGATGLKDTNIRNKILAVKKALVKYDFVFCHIKAADTFGHDGDCLGKKEFIEKIDKEIKILSLPKVLLAVTADHSTPCVMKDHSSDSVPLLVYNDGHDAVQEFSEQACRKGGLGEIRQTGLMKLILKLRKPGD